MVTIWHSCRLLAPLPGDAASGVGGKGATGIWAARVCGPADSASRHDFRIYSHIPMWVTSSGPDTDQTTTEHKGRTVSVVLLQSASIRVHPSTNIEHARRGVFHQPLSLLAGSKDIHTDRSGPIFRLAGSCWKLLGPNRCICVIPAPVLGRNVYIHTS